MRKRLKKTSPVRPLYWYYKTTFTVVDDVTRTNGNKHELNYEPSAYLLDALISACSTANPQRNHTTTHLLAPFQNWETSGRVASQPPKETQSSGKFFNWQKDPTTRS